MLYDDYRQDKKRPFNKEELFKSFQDGREIYAYGKRVEDVTTHPAFRNSAASIGKIYDALHDPEYKDRLC